MAQLALDCVHREYPNNIQHLLRSDADARPPHDLTPAFYGCFDWHSAVHSHWLLVRLCRECPGAEFVPSARAALARSFTAENVDKELSYLSVRPAFERPYGMAWLLQLVAELHEWDDDSGSRWRALLKPLEAHAASVFETWLPKLTLPIRSGVHGQTAFSLGLVHDWTSITGAKAIGDLVEVRSLELYGEDRAAPLAYEPSGHDFLSPSLAQADLLRRFMTPGDYRVWLNAFLGDFHLEPVAVTDPSDGHLVHLDGLNLSRAWMLEGIASVAPAPRLTDLAVAHRSAGLRSMRNPTYAGAHWLGSFAAYLLTRRGISDDDETN